MSTASESTSRSLLARARANDAAAWDRLVTLYAPFVLSCCRRARVPAADVPDVFQETFQAAAAGITRFEKKRTGGTFRGWLRTITQNKAIDHLRRQQGEPRGIGGTEIQLRMADVAAPAAQDSTLETRLPAAQKDGAEARLLRAALERVRPCVQDRTWRAFVATVIDGRAPKDVADDLDMSPGAVRVAKSRVLQRLRSELGDPLP